MVRAMRGSVGGWSARISARCFAENRARVGIIAGNDRRNRALLRQKLIHSIGEVVLVLPDLGLSIQRQQIRTERAVPQV